MKITAFGITRDILGCRELVLEKKNAGSVRELRDYLLAKYPEIGRLKSLAIAVNQQYASDDEALSEDSEIVLIPPVSGG